MILFGDHGPAFVGAAIAAERAADPPELELYDLAADPWEFEKLADGPEHAATLAALQAVLLEWRAATADPLLTPDGRGRGAAVTESRTGRAAHRTGSGSTASASLR